MSIIINNQDMLDILYPIDSIYITYNEKNPQTFLGGTWIKICSGAYIAGYNDTNGNYSLGNGGTTNTRTLSTVPAHSHSFSGSGSLANGGGHNSSTSNSSVSMGAHSSSYATTEYHAHSVKAKYTDSQIASGTAYNRYMDGGTQTSGFITCASAGAHSHVFTVAAHNHTHTCTVGNGGSTHSHTITFSAMNTSSEGSSSPTAFSILPSESYAVNFWKRTA